MNKTLLFYIVDILVYPLLVYVVMVYLVRHMDVGSTDAAGAGMAKGFAYAYGCIFVCALWFVASFFIAHYWAGNAWHAIPALAGGMIALWLPPQIKYLVESNIVREYAEYYGSDVLYEKGKYIGNNSDRHGEITFYRQDGTVERIEQWRRGKPHGLKRTFYPNGNPQTEGNVYSMFDPEDYHDGKWRFYREDGALDDERTYDQDKLSASKNYSYWWMKDSVGDGRTLCRVGSCEPFTGSLECDAVVGKEPLPTYYTCQITNGVIDGAWSAYVDVPDRADRPLVGCGKIVDGRSVGVYTVYYPNGQLESLRTYRDGKIEGEYTAYYADSVAVEPHGKVEYRCNYINGKRNGTAYWYREDGTLDQTSDYVNGERHGWERVYGQNGELVSETEYRNDEEVYPKQADEE